MTLRDEDRMFMERLADEWHAAMALDAPNMLETCEAIALVAERCLSVEDFRWFCEKTS